MAASAEPVIAPVFSRGRLVELLKAEMAPHPGMYSTLARIVLTVVITFLLVATFRMPYAAITLYSIFTVDRSSHRAAILRACESIVAITLGVGMALIGVMLFADIPPLTFAYYAFELFVAAFLIRTTRLPGPAMNMSMAIYSVHNAWELPYPAGPHLQQTLWVWLTLCLGFVVSVMIELAFVREDPVRLVQAELAGRMQALSNFFNACVAGISGGGASRSTVLSYASVGTSSVRQRINALRNNSMPARIPVPTMAALTALVARLIDVSATLECPVVISEAERNRLARLADALDTFRAEFDSLRLPRTQNFDPPLTPSEAVPTLPELERTVALIPMAFEASQAEGDELVDPQGEVSIFLPDALTNYGYRLFALKTMLAAMLCYVTYSALHWPGISTSVVTCMVTALNTTGATKQKQALRLLGATTGGLIALAAIVFLLPELDSITSVTVLVACVSAFSGWFVVASQRLSYFGLQTALAFYLAFIQDYTSTTQLAPARDRAAGVLLGLAMMWLVFDNLWPVSALEHMKAGLARNLRLLAELITAVDAKDRNSAIRTIRALRESIQRGFAAVHGHADSVLFEIGSPNRRQQLEFRNSALRMQANLRTLFLVEIAICQYRTQVEPGTRPIQVREAQADFDRAVADRLRQIATALDELRPFPGEPRLQDSYDQLDIAVEPWAQTLENRWLLSRVAGLKALSREAATLVNSLSQHCCWS